MFGFRVHRRVGGVLVALTVLATSPALAQTATAGFLERLSELSSQAGDLLTRAEAVNAAWEGGEAGFQDSLEGFRQIETDAALLLVTVQETQPPEQFTAVMDQLTAGATNISASASALVAGLLATDSGQARQAAMEQFRTDVRSFETTVAETVATATTTTTTLIEATTSTATQATTSSTAPTASSSTTTVSIIAAPTSGTDDGGAPWALVPIALMAGLALGAVGGLVLGANARRRLIDQLKTARGPGGG